MKRKCDLKEALFAKGFFLFVSEQLLIDTQDRELDHAEKAVEDEDGRDKQKRYGMSALHGKECQEKA